MAGRIVIDTERCKGCGLCITVCPKKNIVVAQESNKNGYFPAQANNHDCNGCAACATICPDVVIEVSRDVNIVAVKPASNKENKKSNIFKSLSREKVWLKGF